MPRSSPPRTKIAAAGTLAALGVLAAVATASSSQQQRRAPAPRTFARPAPAKTVVVHRTVGVRTRFVPAPAARRPATQRTSAPAPAPIRVARRAATPSRPSRRLPSAQPERTSVPAPEGLPAPGITEGECPPLLVGGVPSDATTSGARPRVIETAASPERRARPPRTTHPLPEDIPGVPFEACAAVPPAATDAAATGAGATVPSSALGGSPGAATP